MQQKASPSHALQDIILQKIVSGKHPDNCYEKSCFGGSNILCFDMAVPVFTFWSREPHL